MAKQTISVPSDTPAAEAELTFETAAKRDVRKPAKPKAAKPRTAVGEGDAPKRSAASGQIEILTARISELQAALLQGELDTSSQALSARVKRLEKDIATYREARMAAEFIATDLRASLDRSAATLEHLRASPAYRLGSLLIAASRDWRAFIRLPASLVQWVRDSRRHREETEAQLIPAGSATEYTAAVERALEIAEQRGAQEAERWAIDQRFRAPVTARVLTELAALARGRDPDEAVRLAEAALQADPSESRVKRLAFLMAESGSVTHAARMLRSAMEKGATFNGTEDARAQEIFALSDLAATGPTLIPKRQWNRPAGAANRRVLIYSPQAFPFHWTSASIRTHTMAVALTDAGIVTDVATVPGYPNLGRRTPIEGPPSRNIDEIDYHLLPATKASPGLGYDYVKQTSLMIAGLIKRLDASILIAPSEFTHAYPAAIASQIAGASLVLDGWSLAPDEAHCRTERSQIFSRIETQIFQYASVVLARTPTIADRLRQAAPAAQISFLPDSAHRTSTSQPAEKRADNGEFVFGYVGDNALDVDVESLGRLLKDLVAARVDARLVIYSVGGRIQAIREQLALEGLGNRVTIVEKSPPGRRSELAYNGLDVVVVPLRLAEDVMRSPFQISSALRHGKCVVAIGAEEYKDMFGDAVVHANDAQSAVQTLLELARDAGRRQRLEAEARGWDERHPGAGQLVEAIRAV